MTDLALRPLSLGEILDRAFSLYRSRFTLFIGITAIPRLVLLAVALVNSLFITKPGSVTITPNGFPSFDPGTIIFNVLFLVFSGFIALFAQGGTILAVSELYLGRSTSATESLRRASSEIALLFGIALLSGLAIVGASILLIIPGIYVACRLLVCVPAALIEKLGPRASLSRGFALTKGFAGRGFGILVLSIVLIYAAQALFALPLGIPLAMSANDPVMVRVWTALLQVSSSIATILVSPIPYIAISIFYFDLRVRKEAFDLQFMMNPDVQRPPDASGMTSIVS
jgi:hypothetical protein